MVSVVVQAELRISKSWFKLLPVTDAMSLGMYKEREFQNELFIPFFMETAAQCLVDQRVGIILVFLSCFQCNPRVLMEGVRI